MRAAVVFVIQRADVTSFSPHDKADPDFSSVLRDARRSGVEVYAYRCRVSTDEIAITDAVPVIL
jgi:sugar fermentation stimulation protein A